MIFAGGIDQQRAKEGGALEYGDHTAGKEMHGPQVCQPLGVLIEHAQDALRAPDGHIGQRHAANLLDPANTRTRFDAIFHSQEADKGLGVAYQVQYALRTGARSPKLWIEDTGRWFADADGKPVRAHGLLRIINDRYEHEQQLAYLSRFDAQTGEINRWHLTEQLEQMQTGGKTNMAESFKLFAARGRRQGLAVIISDFLDPGGYESALKVLQARGHDVYVVQMASKADRDPGAVAERLRVGPERRHEPAKRV